MAYNQVLTTRIGSLLFEQNVDFTEKKMFGGVGYMINDKMCIGIIKEELMLRIMDDKFEKVVSMKYAKSMQFTGKPMSGFILVEPEGLTTDTTLLKWLEYGIEFGKYGVLKTKKKIKKK